MTIKTVESTLTPLEQENLALDFFELKFSLNPKKLVQLAKRMYPTQPDFVQRGLLMDVMNVKDPVNYLRRCFALREQFVKAIDDFSSKGHHGMMVVGDNIYPLTIATSKNWLRPKDRWNYDEELDIQDKLINEWMDSYGVKIVKDAKIVLFTNFGFSGIPRGWAWGV